MASPEQLDYVKRVKSLLQNVPEEDAGLTTQIALDYGKQLQQAQIPFRAICSIST